jgi:hypothetical protein
MNNNKQETTTQIELLMLFVLLVFAFFIAYIPHINYSYPVHVDEYNQLAYAQALVHEGSIDFGEPFYGEWGQGINYGLFPGYYLLLGIIQQVCGMNLVHMPVYLPGILIMITVLGVYSYARRKGFGWEAALFTCLIPTTVGLLGPGFMVPVATGLLIVPLLLFLIDHQNRMSSYILCFIISCFLLLMHPPSALIMLVIVVPYILLTMTRDVKKGVSLLLVFSVPYIFTLVVASDIFLKLNEQTFTQQSIPSYIEFPALVQLYGYLPLLCGILGIMVLVIKNKIYDYGLILSLIALLATLMVFYQFHFGLPLVYLRTLLYTLLLLGIIAGAGLASVRMMNIRTFNIGRYLYAGIFITILIVAIPARLSIPYYNMMDEGDYNAFTWIKDNISDAHDMVVLDPWKATAFTAITYKNVYERIFPAQEPMDDMVYNFLHSKCRDTHFLEYEDINIIYNPDDCNNTDLINIRENVYLFNPGKSQYNAVNNMLRNPGMWEISQNVSPIAWWTWDDNVQPNYLYPETDKNDGYSIGIEIPKDNDPEIPFSASWRQKVTVKKKCTYILTGWIKTENIEGSGGARIVANWHNSNDEWIGSSDIMGDITGTHHWYCYEGEVVAPEDAKYCIVSCQIVNSTGKAWFDDMLFMKRPINNK